MKKTMGIVLAAVLVLGDTSCTFISKSTEFNAVPGQHGKPVEIYEASTVAVYLLFFLPIVGDATMTATVNALTAKVKEDGGTNVRVYQSGTSYLWYVLFPFSIIIHPVITSVSSDVEFEGPAKVENAKPEKASAKGKSTR